VDVGVRMQAREKTEERAATHAGPASRRRHSSSKAKQGAGGLSQGRQRHGGPHGHHRTRGSTVAAGTAVAAGTLSTRHAPGRKRDAKKSRSSGRAPTSQSWCKGLMFLYANTASSKLRSTPVCRASPGVRCRAQLSASLPACAPPLHAALASARVSVLAAGASVMREAFRHYVLPLPACLPVCLSVCLSTRAPSSAPALLGEAGRKAP
jgi:hypothetical protein